MRPHRSSLRAGASLVAAWGALVAAAAGAQAAPATFALESTANLTCRTFDAGRIDPATVAGWYQRTVVDARAPRYLVTGEPAALTDVRISSEPLAGFTGYLSDAVDTVALTVGSLVVTATDAEPARLELVLSPVRLPATPLDEPERSGFVLPAGPITVRASSAQAVRIHPVSARYTVTGTAAADPSVRESFTVSCDRPTPYAENPSLPVSPSAPGSPALVDVAPRNALATQPSEVVLTGPGLASASVVRFGSRIATILDAPDASTIRVRVPGGATPGVVPVTVTTPDGTTPATDAATFTFLVPRISVPRAAHAAVAGGSRVVVGIDGLDPTDAVAEVRFGDVPGTAVQALGPGAVGVTAPPHPVGRVALHLRTTRGLTISTAGDAFEYRAGSWSPTDGFDLDGGTLVTVSGLDLTGATGIEFDGKPGTDFRVLGPDRAAVVAASVEPSRTGGRVAVRFADGTEVGVGVNVPEEPYSALTPDVLAVSPAGGPATGGTTVTITGDDLRVADGVLFGSRPAASWTRTGPSTIVAVAPPGIAGNVSVRVTGGLGEPGIGPGFSPDTPADDFTYTAAPEPPPVLAKITSLWPRTQAAGRSGFVIIGGARLAGTRAVQIGDRKVRPLVVTAGAILAPTPALEAGSYPVTLISAAGQTDPATAPKLRYR